MEQRRSGLSVGQSGAPRSRTALAFVALLGLLLVTAGAARAESPPVPKADREMAEAMFLQGKRLLAEGNVALACERFEQSHKLDPAGGALLNLGNCYEREGRTASAWQAYNEALAWARADERQDRIDFALAHIRELEPDLARLVITVPPGARVRELQLLLDGVPVASSAWGARVPVDPGKHRVEARAEGRALQVFEFTAEPGKEQTFTLSAASSVAPAAPAEPDAMMPGTGAPPPAGSMHLPVVREDTGASSGGNAQRVWGWVLGGVGVAGVGAGVGLLAATDQKGVGIGVLAGGAAVLATGVVLIATSGSSAERVEASLAVAPLASPSGAGLWVLGRF